MASISIGEAFKFCTSLAKFIRECIGAMREKKDICDVLKTLEATVNLTGSFMEQYILYPDQLNAWLRHLANLQSSILELMKKLEVIAPGKIVFESVKFVLLCRLGLKGQMEKLKKGRDDLKLLQQEILLEAVHKNVLRAIKKGQDC